MKLSDTQRIVLSHGAQHPQLLAIAPKHLPVAACRAVVNSLIKSRLLIEVAAPRDQLAMVWRKDADGTPILIQVTDEELRAIGIQPNEGGVARDTAPQGGESPAPQQDDAVTEQSAQAAPEAPNMGSVNLREAAERLLAAWEETPPANAKHDPIAQAMAMLRNALSRRGTRATGAPRKPREGTKQEVVLAMLRRPEGATVAQIAEANAVPLQWWEPASKSSDDPRCLPRQFPHHQLPGTDYNKRPLRGSGNRTSHAKGDPLLLVHFLHDAENKANLRRAIALARTHNDG